MYFLSEALGVKLNRGSDGMVRVLSVAPDTPGSPILRQGSPLQEGDVIREAAGVDLRRPITNVMWGDTVALIKIAPRPIAIVVAQEISPMPPSVVEERKRQVELEEKRQLQRSLKQQQQQLQQQPPGSIGVDTSYDEDDDEEGDHIYEEDYMYYHHQPSPSSGEEKVEIRAEAEGVSATIRDNNDTTASSATAVVSDQASSNAGDLTTITTTTPSPADSSSHVMEGQVAAVAPTGDTDLVESHVAEVEATTLSGSSEGEPSAPASRGETEVTDEATVACSGPDATTIPVLVNDGESPQTPEIPTNNDGDIRLLAGNSKVAPPGNDNVQPASPRDEEMNVIGGEILFEDSSSAVPLNGWDRLRWMSYSGIRKVRLCESVARLATSRKTFFWATSSGDEYLHRKLAIYEEPPVMLLLRRPVDVGEIRRILDLPSGMVLGNDSANVKEAFWIVESVIEPKACKLRLSPLTTVTSVETLAGDDASARRFSCFELVSPAETIVLCAARTYSGSSFENETWVETQFLEEAIGTALFQAHVSGEEGEVLQRDRSWKHQIILGTLHSYVLAGNQSMLEKSIARAMARLHPPQSQPPAGGSTRYLPTQLIDARDDNGLAALHYACSRGLPAAVSLLVDAGANVTLKASSLSMSPAHFCAIRLDASSLATVLSATYPTRPDPNEVDALGRTPMYVAAVDGRTADGSFNAVALGQCLSALEAWGGQVLVVDHYLQLQNPVSVLASEWRSDSLLVLFQHVAYRFPLLETEHDARRAGISLSAMFHYPVHCALLAFKKEARLIMNGGKPLLLCGDELQPECRLVS